MCSVVPAVIPLTSWGYSNINLQREIGFTTGNYLQYCRLLHQANTAEDYPLTPVHLHLTGRLIDSAVDGNMAGDFIVANCRLVVSYWKCLALWQTLAWRSAARPLMLLVGHGWRRITGCYRRYQKSHGQVGHLIKHDKCQQPRLYGIVILNLAGNCV